MHRNNQQCLSCTEINTIDFSNLANSVQKNVHWQLRNNICLCLCVCPPHLCVAGCCCCCPGLWSSPGWSDSQPSVAAHWPRPLCCGRPLAPATQHGATHLIHLSNHTYRLLSSLGSYTNAGRCWINFTAMSEANRTPPTKNPIYFHFDRVNILYKSWSQRVFFAFAPAIKNRSIFMIKY